MHPEGGATPRTPRESADYDNTGIKCWWILQASPGNGLLWCAI